jgi:hypothetical protein
MFIYLALLCIPALALLWRLTRRVEDAVDLNLFDAATEGDVALACGQSGRVATRIAFDAAMACKDKYGELRYNNANRLVVGDFVRDHLRREYPDLRVVDRVMHATYAIELALTPTVFAVAAARYSQNRAVVDRRAAVALPK